MIYMYMFMLFISSWILMILGVLFLYLKLNFFFHWSLFMLNSLIFEFIIYLDWMTMFFLSVVSLISSMVLLYSVSYMEGDKTLNRFFYLVLLFIMSMFLMVISPNIFSILLGWDGLGLVSYGLVIYYQNWKSYKSGMVTVLLNRFGDVGILMIISLMMIKGSWNLMFYFGESWLVIILLIFSACTKSAQFPFSLWLPLAMAAPTPVSSLVHSSTLVTAGVYLMIRFNLLIMDFSGGLFFISSITMFLAGVSANWSNDLKKIIAMSTLSQLGLMMSILSLGEVNLGFFHLIMHALFKSLLFMCVGAVIHLMSNNQDIRCMGGLVKFYPFLSTTFVFSILSLCGFPFLSGFYSKDLIIEFFLMSKISWVSLLLILFATMSTVSYSVRLLIKVFVGPLNKVNYMFLMNEDWLMSVSMLILYSLSLIGGFMLLNMFFYIEKIIILKFLEKTLVFMSMILGVFMGIWRSKYSVKLNDTLFGYSLIKIETRLFLSTFIESMFGLNIMYKYMWKYIDKVAFNFYMKVDKGMMEFVQVTTLKNKLNFLMSLFNEFSFISMSGILKYFIIMILLFTLYLM